jgi:hypothetical protein
LTYTALLPIIVLTIGGLRMSEINTVIRAIADELVKEDQALTDANEIMRLAQIRWQIALRKYVAIRELATSRFRESPYLNPSKWGISSFPSEGRFRFHDMSAGDALLTALKEAQRPLELEELQEVINKGGLYLPPRNLNAALLQTKGVAKTDQGYVYDPESEEIRFE